MAILSDKVLTILRSGNPVAAEITASRPDFRAFVMIIPQVPNPRKNSDAWIHWGQGSKPNEGGVLRIKDISFIKGYEVRFLEHHSKYTNEHWGWDYDYVLDDETTRVKRVFTTKENELEGAVTHWLNDSSKLQEPSDFDSSLVNSPIEVYLNRPDERPHLWL